MKSIALVFILVLVFSGPAFSELSNIQIEPNDPIVGEMVTVTVSGFLPNTCFSLEDQICGILSDQEVVIEIFTYDCFGRECNACGWDATLYEVVCEIETKTAGTYNIQVTEYNDSINFPSSNEMTLGFEVLGVVSSESTSWSTIKSRYR